MDLNKLQIGIKILIMIDVTAAILKKDNKYLIAKRIKGGSLEGRWEFPGGKIESGETPEECLKRELLEEFGIESVIRGFLTQNVYDYGDRKIRLLGYYAEYVSGDFVLSAHDEIKWVDIQDLDSYDFAPADIPLIQKLKESSRLNPL